MELREIVIDQTNFKGSNGTQKKKKKDEFLKIKNQEKALQPKDTSSIQIKDENAERRLRNVKNCLKKHAEIIEKARKWALDQNNLVFNGKNNFTGRLMQDIDQGSANQQKLDAALSKYRRHKESQFTTLTPD